MPGFDFLPDPSLWKLREAYRKLCSDGEGGKPTLALDDETLFIMCGSKILGQFELFFDKYPVDSNMIVSSQVLPTEDYTLFDNKLNLLLSSATLNEDKQYVRAFVLMIKYQDVDDAGSTIEYADKNTIIEIFMRDGTSFEMPLYNFYSTFTNPVTLTQTEIIDKVVISNPSSTASIYVNALILSVKASVQENDPQCS